MGARGRVSAAALTVVQPDVVDRVARALAPEDLTPEQAEEWRAVVDRMPAEWFGRETYGMLAQYCRHVVAARRVAHLIDKAEAGEEFDLREYDQLLKMQEREGRALSSLATRMRLSQQSAYDKTKKQPARGLNRPWHRQEK